MKVVPSNQTLILASERGLQTTASTRVPYSAENALKRLTVVAARPDDTVLYVQAEYASTSEYVVHAQPSAGVEAEDPDSEPSLQMRPPAPSSPPISSAVGFYRANRGVELYVSTQSMGEESEATQIDVHA